MNSKGTFIGRTCLSILLLLLAVGVATAGHNHSKIAYPFSETQIPLQISEAGRGSVEIMPGTKTVGDPVDMDAALIAGANYLRHAQADVTEDNAGNGDPDVDLEDGGWDWRLTAPNFIHSSSSSPTNLYGVTARGLYYAYLETADASYMTAMQDAATYMIGVSNIRSAGDLIFLMLFQDLPGVTPDIYSDAAQTKFDARIAPYGSATAWAEYIRDFRAGQGYENGIIPWDIGAWVVAAQMLEDRYPSDPYDYAQAADDMAEVIYQDSYEQAPGYFDLTTDKNNGWDPTYSNTDYYWYTLGITGILDAFEAANIHTDKISDLLTILLDCQYSGGAFSYCYGANTDDEDWQSTAYAVMTLARLDQSTYQTNINHACYWVGATQDPDSGGWVYSSGNHYPEVGGECTGALYFGENASEVWVDDDYTEGGYNDGHMWGYDAFDNIQDGIDAVASSIVNVAAGTYNVATQVLIDKALTLIGEDAATTIIDGPGSSVAIPCEGLIAVDGVSGSVTIKNFTLQDAPERAATWEIYLLAVKNMPAGASVTIEDNILIGRDDSNAFDGGIWIAEGSASSQATIRNNDLSKVYRGIVMERMLGPSTVENNDIHHLVAGVFAPDTYAAQGLYYLTYTGDVTTQQLAKENTFRDYAGYDIMFQGGHAYISDGKFTNVKIQDNTVNAIGSGPEDAHVGIILYNYPATDLNACGVHNAEITGNTITTGGTDSKGVVVHGQNTGIYISNNEIANLGTGILVEGTGTPDVTVNGNSITGNTVMGFNNNTAVLMNASGNWWGINTPAGVAAEVSANVDYTPWLHDGTDQSTDPGFQPDLSYLHVDDTSPQTGTIFRIQEGVDMVTGSTVYVQNGTYGADPATGRGVYITKDGLSLIGESETGTIIDGAIGGVGSSGSYWPKGIHVQANNVTVQNFAVQGFTGDLVNTGGYGVLHRDYAHDTEGEGWIFYDGCTVDNVTVQNCYSVVYALCFTHLTVSNCILNNNFSDGMFIARGSDYATIHDNTVTNSGDHGIWVGNCWMGLRPSHDATIYNNTVNGAREGGISFVGSNNAVIHHNSITNAAGDGWSVGALSLKDGPTNVEAHHNTIFNNSGTWNGYNGTGHGVGIDGAASNIDLHHNSIYGNSGLGVYNSSSKDLVGSWERHLIEDGNLPTFDDMVSLGGNKGSKALVLAEQNWWGAYCGPYHPTTNPNGQGDEVSDNVDYEPWCDSTFTECDFSTTPPSIVWVDDGYTPLGANDGHYWCYDAFDKIQDGVDAVATGGTVNVAAGTYEEQVRIDGKGVDLVGTGIGQSIIEAVPVVDRVTYTITQWTGSSRTIDACVGATDAGNVNISGFTVDGKELGPDNFYGIHYFNTGGSVTDCRIEDVTDAAHPSNSRVVSLVATHGDGETITIDFSNNVIPNFQKGGILVMGPGATFTVNGNSVSGVVSSSIAGNCIQLSYGATGTTANNYVEGTAYTGTDWASTGILLFECGDISMDGDSAYDCESGVNFSDWGWIYNHPVPVNLGFANLALDNNEWSLGIQLSRDNSDVNMTVTGCDVSNSTGDGIDFYCTGAGSYYTGWDNGDLNATVTGSNITGSALDGIWGADYSGNANNVSISVNYCMFSGNVGSAINNDFTQMMDATACYWDDPSGPTIGVKSGATRQVAPAPSPYGDDLPNDGIVVMTETSNAVKGSGETIYGPIDYSPWWGDNYVGDPHADPWTWYVNTSNNSTIQEGIEAASSLDTLRARPGTYEENAVIDKSLALLGAGQDSVLVYPATSDIGMPDPEAGPSFRGSQIFVVEATEVTIEGFTFDGDHPTLTPLGTIDARNGIITNYNTGDWSNLKVRDCTAKNIYLRAIYASAQNPNNLTGVDISNNVVSNVKGSSMQSAGIMLWGSSGDAKHNDVSDASIGIFYHWNSDGNMDSNTVTTSELGLGVNNNDSPTSISHNTITDSDQGIQSIAVDSPVNVELNQITACTSGVVLYGGGSGETNVWENDIEGLGTYGTMGVYASTDLDPWGLGDLSANLKRNTIKDNFYGIVLNEPSGNTGQLLSILIGGALGDYNLIYDNLNYELLMEYCDDDQTATYNYWGYSLYVDIEDEIFHQTDQPSFGLVTYDPAILHGDINLNGVVNLGDVVYLINYLYKGGPEPEVFIVADINRDGQINLGDVVYLINYLYRGGPPPDKSPKVAGLDLQKQELSLPAPGFDPMK